MRRTVSTILLALALVSCAAQRELVIDSTPPGALVRLDDSVVGTTPFHTTFDAYGTRRVTLYKDGFRSQTRLVEIKPPWYGRFPFDIVSEVLLPVGWPDRHEESFELVAESGTVTIPDLTEVLKRAENLRLAEPTGPRPSNAVQAPQKPKEKPE